MWNMYRRPSKKQEFIKRTLIYAAMTIMVGVGVTALIFIILGYQYDVQNGHVEQGALIQLDSVPNGASVTIDGKLLGGKTPTKASVLAGTHTFAISKPGYEIWNKTTNINAGTLTWLDYMRLVPVLRPVVAVQTYSNVFNSLAAVDGRSMLIQPEEATPTFSLVDLGSDAATQTTISLPASLYTDAKTAGVTHSFRIDQWDSGGRYVLIQHTYAHKSEWIELDTKDVSSSKNISTLLSIPISSAWLSGTNGSTVFALSGGDIRKLDLAAGTISRAFATHVTSLTLFNNNVITYIGTDATDATKRVVGLYRDGDSDPHILRTTTATADVPLNVATSRYINKDYVAISEGSKVDVYGGSYPASATDDNNSLVLYDTFSLPSPVTTLSFSPTGYYILAQNAAQFMGYDIEHKIASTSSIVATKTTVRPLQWLDNSYVWSDADGSLTMREFDGSNTQTINTSSYGQDAALTKDGRYLYSLGKTTSGYQLQRVRMILP